MSASDLANAVDIVVCGGINIDRFFEVNRLPAQGETIISKSSFVGVGGKAANTAVSCSRMGATTHLISAFGNDDHTEYLMAQMQENDIDTQSCFSNLKDRSNKALDCSQAYIFSLPNGDNSIIVVPAVNKFWPSKFTAAQTQTIGACDAILLQREIPEEYNLRVARAARAHARDIPVILDAGGSELAISDELYNCTFILSPNETELVRLVHTHFDTQLLINPNNALVTKQKERLANIDSLPKMKEACEILQTFNPKMHILLKRGAKGCVMFDCHGNILIQPAVTLERSQVVDTTGAGDTFTGAFVVEWIRQKKFAANAKKNEAVDVDVDVDVDVGDEQKNESVVNADAEAEANDTDGGKTDTAAEESANTNGNASQSSSNIEKVSPSSPSLMGISAEDRQELEYFGNAMRFACAAAGLSVQKKGTLPSIPNLDSVVQCVLSNSVK